MSGLQYGDECLNQPHPDPCSSAKPKYAKRHLNHQPPRELFLIRLTVVLLFTNQLKYPPHLITTNILLYLQLA